VKELLVGEVSSIVSLSMERHTTERGCEVKRLNLKDEKINGLKTTA